MKFTVAAADVTGLVLKLEPARNGGYGLTGQGELVPEIVADKRLAGRVLLSSGKPAPKGIDVLVICVGGLPSAPDVKCGGSWGGR